MLIFVNLILIDRDDSRHCKCKPIKKEKFEKLILKYIKILKKNWPGVWGSPQAYGI